MKTNRPVPSDIWTKIEASLTQPSIFDWQPKRIGLLAGVVALFILSFFYINHSLYRMDKQDVNAYLYEIHAEVYPDEIPQDDMDMLLDLI